MTYVPAKFEVATSTVKGEMHLQDNILLDLRRQLQDHTNVAQDPIHYMTYAPAKGSKLFRGRCIYRKMNYLTFYIDRWVKVTRTVAQCPLHYAKFGVVISNDLREDTITRNVMGGVTDRRTMDQVI